MITLDELMTDLSTDVHAVDLRDRVRVTSRRLAVRRAIGTTAGAVVAVAVVGGLVHTVLPHRAAPVTPPAVTTATAPTASPSATPPTAAATPAVVGRPVWTSIPADLRYVEFDGQSHLRQGSGPVFTPSTGGCAMTLSPDGKHLAWGTSDGSTIGDLVVADPDGKHPRTVLHDLSCQGGNGPFWAPDSQHLLVTPDGGDRALVDVTTGAVSQTPLAHTAGYVAWSPTGSTVAYADGGKVVVARPDGTVVHRFKHGDESGSGGFSVQGVSDDGRRVVVGARNSDPSIIRSGFRLLDTTNGQAVALPNGITGTPSVYPLAGSQLLIRQETGNTHRLYLIGKNGSVRDHKTEPAALNNSDLLLTQ